MCLPSPRSHQLCSYCSHMSRSGSNRSFASHPAMSVGGLWRQSLDSGVLAASVAASVKLVIVCSIVGIALRLERIPADTGVVMSKVQSESWPLKRSFLTSHRSCSNCLGGYVMRKAMLLCLAKFWQRGAMCPCDQIHVALILGAAVQVE